MKMGHVQGTKKETKGATDWYDAIAEANIARIEAEDAARALVTALAIQVGNAVTALPEAATRIARVATLVQHREVWPLTDGTFLVGSENDTVKAYLVRRGPRGAVTVGTTRTVASHASISWPYSSPSS